VREISKTITEKDIQSLIIEYNILKSLIEELQKRSALLAQLSNEINDTITSLRHIGESEEKEVLLPLGSMIFLKAKNIDVEKIIVKIGANVLVEKPLDSALDYLTKIKSEVDLEMMNTNRRLEEAIVRYRQLDEILSKIASEKGR